MTIHIITPTPNLAQSLDFYHRLGFVDLESSTATLVTDGSLVIEISDDRKTRAGIKVYADDVDTLAQALAPHSPVLNTETGYLLSDPTGTHIYLTAEAPPTLPSGSETRKVMLGNFAGLTLEAVDAAKTVAIYEVLGFAPSMGALESGWVSLSHPSGMGVSVMVPRVCPHLFFNPSLTFFNGGNNLETIAKVRQAQIPITEEITAFNDEGIVDNIIIRDPGGYGFFVFND